MNTETDMRKFVIQWWAWPEGARIPSRGEEVVHGDTREGAVRVFMSRFPAADRIENVQEANHEHRD